MSTTAMYVQQLWRYPVKSMTGEALERAELRLDGIAGDRLVVVHGPNGLVTSRTRPELLALHGTLSPDGEALVGHLPTASGTVRAMVPSRSEAAAPGCECESSMARAPRRSSAMRGCSTACSATPARPRWRSRAWRSWLRSRSVWRPITRCL